MKLVNIVRAAVNVLHVVDLVDAIPVGVWATTGATRKKNVMLVAERARARCAIGWGNAISAKEQDRNDGDDFFRFLA
jgi:hypothetical protein